MSKQIEFMRKDLLTQKDIDTAVAFLQPLFDNDNLIFKKMLTDGSAYLEDKRFTMIKFPKEKILYRLMGNCIGPVVYVRDILPLES